MSDWRLFAWKALLPENASISIHGLPDDETSDSHTRSAVGPCGMACYGEPSNCSINEFQFYYRFAILPGFDDPRRFIPLDNSQVARGSLSLYEPFQDRARMMRQGALLATRLPRRIWRSRQLTLSLSSPLIIEESVRRVLDDESFAYAILPGHPENPGKVTVAVLDLEGTLRAICRVATDSSGSERVRTEARVLEALSANPRMVGIAPYLLALEEAHGKLISIQSALPGSRPEANWSPLHEEVLAALESEEVRPLRESETVSLLQNSISGQGDVARELHDALQAILSDHGDDLVPRVIEHGDFAPWNLKSHLDRLAAFDWEFATQDGLPLVDRVHFELQKNLLLDHGPLEAGLPRLEAVVKRSPLPERISRALVQLGILKLASRELPNRNWVHLRELLNMCSAVSPASSRRRTRVLMSAYACEPGRGSEPAVGWNWAVQAANHSDVWVVTRANNREVIDAELSKSPQPNLRFIYHDLPTVIQCLKKRSGFVQAYYYVWQLSAIPLARRLERELEIDVGHHVTFVSCRFPSFLAFIQAPLVWGPIAGLDEPPSWAFRDYPTRNRLSHRLRRLSNRSLQFDPFVRHTMRKASIILAATSANRNGLPSFAAVKARIEPAVGITPPASDFNREREFSETRLLYVGNLLYLKGLRFLLLSIAALGRNVGEIRLTVVGTGPEEASLKLLAHELRIGHVVDFVGKLPYSEVQSLYRRHDILVFPSLQDSGGFVVLEAASYGLPIICMNVGGPAQIVNTSMGIVIDIQDPQQMIRDLANAIGTLASDISLSQSLGENARKTVGERYSWHRLADLLPDMYERALSQTST
ncbi:MAG: glycosyltransferase [Thermomicrobiales bacterium]|nr:glycosyltransferase [Thermomicrobiales bacterium]